MEALLGFAFIVACVFIGRRFAKPTRFFYTGPGKK